MCITQDVTVLPRRCAESRVKVSARRHGPMHPNVIGQVPITTHYPRFDTAADGIVEMNDLRESMHPGIGAPGASRGNWLTRDNR